MNTIIFKNAKKAKVYQVFAKQAFHIYSKGELIKTVKTDNISKLNSAFEESQIEVKEIL